MSAIANEKSLQSLSAAANTSRALLGPGGSKFPSSSIYSGSQKWEGISIVIFISALVNLVGS